MSLNKAAQRDAKTAAQFLGAPGLHRQAKEMILYRGIHELKYQGLESVLTPKEFTSFIKPPKWDIAQWDCSTWGESETNAVIEHQHNQQGLPTSGLSTTPIFERAKFYALGREQKGCGYVISIETELFKTFGIKYFIVNDIVRNPAIPEDEEVIIVSASFGVIPEQVVSEVTKVCA